MWWWTMRPRRWTPLAPTRPDTQPTASRNRSPSPVFFRPEWHPRAPVADVVKRPPLMGGLPGATRERRPHMRTAILEVSGAKQSVRIELRYYYWSSNRWSCPPGYLTASKGYWTTDGPFDVLHLYDDDDELIAVAHDMDVQYLGYPFDG